MPVSEKISKVTLSLYKKRVKGRWNKGMLGSRFMSHIKKKVPLGKGLFGTG